MAQQDLFKKLIMFFRGIHKVGINLKVGILQMGAMVEKPIIGILTEQYIIMMS